MAERVAIIGGSGVYALDLLEDPQETTVFSPFGEMSGPLTLGTCGDTEVVFLPRHGEGHRYNPSEINYRANIDGLKRLGVRDVISLSAVGSLRETLAPGHFVVVDQFIDRTFARAKTFFEGGIVAHVSCAEPVCARLNHRISDALRECAIPHTVGGTYLVMEGPQFSSRAESELYRRWGCDVIGMTNMPEAKLAREAELCYATVAMVTDYDCWHPDHAAVDVATVIKTLSDNKGKAQQLLARLLPTLGPVVSCERGCREALNHAIVTAPEVRCQEGEKRLEGVAGRLLSGVRGG